MGTKRKEREKVKKNKQAQRIWNWKTSCKLKTNLLKMISK